MFRRLLQTGPFWRGYVEAGDEPSLGLPDARELLGDTASRIALRCGPDHELVLTLVAEPRMKSLDLRRRSTGETDPLGWWDDGRWHPFALRWDELTALHRYWSTEASGDVHPSAAFLLLAVFVGNGADEAGEWADRKITVAAHYDRLGIFSSAEVAELVNGTLLAPPDSDYRWSRDPELGWQFAGDYPCYSLRNRPHAEGGEGRFPFTAWNEVMRGLRPRGEADG